jgi:site-specific DNA recombinase
MSNIFEFQRFAKKKNVVPTRVKEVWCYTRVSSKEQESNYSLQTQKISAEKFAQEKGFVLVKTFGGTYESGKDDFTRKEFAKLVEEVKKTKNKPYAILVYNMTRFSRSGGQSITILNELVDKHNVHLFEILSGISTDNPRSRNELNRRLLEAESDNIRKLEVSIPGMKAFLRAGNWLGKAPMGYFHEGPRTTDHDRFYKAQRITLNEVGLKLKLAWQWKLEGVQDYIIVKRLNDLGVNIRLQKLSAMWRNPFYCGFITNKLLDGELIEGHHEQLVSRDIFLRINQNNTKRPQGYNIEKHCEERPLIGDILCYSCGRKLSGYLVKSKGLHYYKCQKCKGVTINANTRNDKRIGAHELFVTLLASYRFKMEFIDLVKDQIVKMIKLTNSSTKKEESLFKKRLTELEGEKENLEGRFAFGKITETLYQKFLTKIDSEIYELKEKSDVPVIDTSNFKNGLNKVIDFVQNVSKYWETGSIEIKKRIQKLVFPSGFYINPINRQYLTPEVNQLFHLISRISMDCDGYKNEIPTKNDEDYRVVAGTGFEPMTFGL